jgi:hypothetical protein
MENSTGGLGANHFDMTFGFEQHPTANSPRQQDLLSAQLPDSALANNFDQSLIQRPLQNLVLARAHKQYLTSHAPHLDHMAQQMQSQSNTFLPATQNSGWMKEAPTNASRYPSQLEERQAQPHDNDILLTPTQTHDHLSRTNQATTHAYYNTNQSKGYSPIEDLFPGLDHNTTLAGAQGPRNDTTRSSPPHNGDASSGSAAIIEPRSMTLVPAPGSDGLRFSSRRAASETCNLLYREGFKIEDDDVIEVEKNKRQHVMSLVRALNHKAFMAAPDTRPIGKGEEKTLDAAEKQAWVDWQNGACENVKIRMAQPNADVNLERRAWEVFDEIVKAHDVGLRHSSLTKDSESKCSQRLTECLQVIQDHAILRQKILDGDKLSDFAVNPQAYARATRLHLWNNHGRAEKLKAEKAARVQAAATAAGQAGTGNTSGSQTALTADTGISHGRRAATSTGAVARRAMSTKDLKQLKKGEPKGRGTGSGAKGTGDDGVPLKTAGATSATPPAAAAEGETGIVLGENHGHARPSNPPFSRSSSDFIGMFRPGPVHLQGQEISHAPPASINGGFDLPDNWDMSPSMRPGPLGMVGYNVSSGVDGAGFFTSGIRHGSTFENYQAPLNSQNHLRRAGVADDPSQRAVHTYGTGSFIQDNQALPSIQSQLHRGEAAGYSDQRATATHGTYGAAPIGGPTKHSQSLVNGPKDHIRKRPRIE